MFHLLHLCPDVPDGEAHEELKRKKNTSKSLKNEFGWVKAKEELYHVELGDH